MSITTDQLASVRAAIAKIEAGAQSITHDGRSLTKASLATLYAREKELMARLAAENAAANGRSRNRVSYVVPD